VSIAAGWRTTTSNRIMLALDRPVHARDRRGV
jgi:hypothetical protein